MRCMKTGGNVLIQGEGLFHADLFQLNDGDWLFRMVPGELDIRKHPVHLIATEYEHWFQDRPYSTVLNAKAHSFSYDGVFPQEG